MTVYGERGRVGERGRLATARTIELESLSSPIAPLSIFFSPFFFLFARTSSLPPPAFLSFSIFLSLPTSTLHHSPRSFPRKLQSMPRRRAMEYVCVLIDSDRASVSLSPTRLFSSSSFSRLFSQTRLLFSKCGFVDYSSLLSSSRPSLSLYSSTRPSR